MSWSLDVIAVGDLINVDEPVSSICSTSFSIVNIPATLFNRPRLCEGNSVENIESLRLILIELEKQNEGLFTDAWCEEADKAWSKGKETHREYEKWALYPHSGMPFKDYTSFFSNKEKDMKGLVEQLSGHKPLINFVPH